MARRGRPPRNPPLSISHPELIAEWHPENKLTPDDVTKGSEIRVLWRCITCQHEWNSLIFNRVRSNCPACSGREVHSDGRNSLERLHPKLAEEWHPENEKVPSRVMPRSSKPVKWKCTICSHSWSASPGNRARKIGGTGCPACAGKVVHEDGRNSLATLFPILAEEWHEDNILSPNEVRPGSTKEVKWRCSSCLHCWTSKVNSRKNSGCPNCWELRRGKKRGSLLEERPDLARDWHPNNSLTAKDISVSSNKKWDWKCHECAHEWKTTPNSRDNSGNGCPACSNKAIHIDGRNSLAVINPILSKEWAESNSFSPSEVLPNSSAKADWVCRVCEFKWNASISSRNSLGSGCPACDGRAIHTDGRNSLLSVNPKLASEWSRKNNFGPDTVAPNSLIDVHWDCSECGHEWEATLGNRNQGAGCPACQGYVVHSDGRNSLAAVHPELCLEWHNDNHLKPSEVTKNADISVKWFCLICNYVWFATVNSRARVGTGCRVCSISGFDPTKPGTYYCFAIWGPDSIWWYKGGISNDHIRRGREIQHSIANSNMDLRLELIEFIDFDIGSDAEAFEKRLLKQSDIREYTIERFSGCTELFNVNPIAYAREKGWL